MLKKFLKSLVGAPTSDAAPQQPLATEQVLRDDSADWQPISTAPINRDLEVRVADSMGHYALMNPCKLIPEQGWINSWLQTPLSHDPVEWREWTEPLVKY
jgi:hypothetical protein